MSHQSVNQSSNYCDGFLYGQALRPFPPWSSLPVIWAHSLVRQKGWKTRTGRQSEAADLFTKT